MMYEFKESAEKAGLRIHPRKTKVLHLSDHDHDCLTNLRFADDVMLFETSKEQILLEECVYERRPHDKST